MSKLILTLKSMVSEAKWFILLLVIYLLMITVIFSILFQEDSIAYVHNSDTFRTLFDSMLGNYNYNVQSDERKYYHTFYMMVHILISNVFLLNYLIAILSTVFEDMNELGNFSFKRYMYMYIERYNKGTENKGYSELVIHVPPVNYLTILLLPFAFISQEYMDKSGRVFSFVIFWLENVTYYIPKMIITEILLIPYIYIRNIFNIMKVESFVNGVAFSLLWLVIGLPYLLYTGAVDIGQYFIVLKMYHENDFKNEQEEEDKLQDKVVIYNEIIDTIRAIKLVFRRKKAMMHYNI